MIATAAALVLSAPLALAASDTVLNSAILPTEHCTRLQQQLAHEQDKHHSATSYQANPSYEEDMALCRQDKDHDTSQAAKARLLDIVPPRG
jgi:hypothetical protein